MSMLNFKYGKYGNLFNTDGSNKLALNEGTVYITTDEKAMYVDLNNGTNVERIRLSQIVNLATTEDWQNLTPPYSKEAFYYIIKANALLKYTDSGWVQINSTSELQTQLNTLSGRVDTLSQTVSDNATTMNNHIGNKKNPHAVTKAQVGLGNVDNKSTATIKSEFTGSVADGNEGFVTGDMVYDAVNGVKTDLNTHTSDKQNPHGVTKAQVGLGNVDNTSDANKPVSTAQDQAIQAAKNAVLGDPSTAVAGEQTVAGANKAAAAASDKAGGVQTNLNTHTSNKNNPHEVTKAQVGLGNVDNTSDTNKPVSTAQKKYVDDTKDALLGDSDTDTAASQTIAGAHKAAAAASAAAGQVQTNLTTHAGKKDNPHAVTKAQVGLGNVDNKSAATLKTDFTGSVASGNTGFATGGATYTAIEGAKTAIFGGTTTTIKGVEDVVKGHTTDIATLKSDVDAVEKDLLNKIQTVDCLKYIGSISAFNQLPTTSSSTKAEIGWTYKVVPPSGGASITPVFTLTAAQAKSGVATPVYVGDLLIATGTEDTTQTSATFGKITSNLKWDYIPSGYVADYNPKFSLSDANATGAGGTDSDNAVSINLTSGAASSTGDLGKIAFKTDADSAIRIVATNTASNAASLTLSLAWGTF